MLKVSGPVVLAAVVAAMGWAGIASAAPLTGDPAADGWTKQGNSVSVGTWVDNNSTDYPGIDANFDVYRITYAISGHTYMGLGGVVLGDIQDSMTDAVIKFATAASTFAPASAVGALDGVGGDAPGGDGMMLVRLNANNVGPNPKLYRVTDAGATFTNLSSVWASYLQYDYIEEPGTYVNWDSSILPTNRLRSFEAVIDLTALGLDYAAVPDADAGSIVAMQGTHPGDFQFNDAFSAAVPEPATLGVLGCGAGMILIRRRRSR